jgi:predicted dehydrogenase
VTAAGPEVHWLRIDGDLGSLVAHDHERRIEVFSELPERHLAGSPTQQTILVPAADTFAAEVRSFVACVGSGVEPLTSGRRQRRPLELVLAAYHSMATGEPVRVV